ncbi:ribosome-recycling factor, mitochondrial [Anabrus simplex]|uniref:ribosome-recycling factor, mitochondrial n=1 Tax=Anabrus simplex TaxID=316456 RepID=UPI0034DD767E
MAAAVSLYRLPSSLSLPHKIYRHGQYKSAASILLRKVCTDLSYLNQKAAQQVLQKPSLFCSAASLQRLTFVGTRYYSKAKDKKKSDKGKKKAVIINEERLSEVISVDSLKNQMQKAVDNMKDDFMKNLSLRSTVGSIETVSVSFEGKEFMLQELAQIVRKNPKTVIINMTSFPQAIPAVLESIQKSGMNLNPQQDGTTIFIPVPKVTKEHRENLAKNAKMLFVKYRDSIRDIQNKYLKQVKRNSSISEDLSHEAQDQIVSLGHQYVSEMDKILEAKQTELIGKH